MADPAWRPRYTTSILDIPSGAFAFRDGPIDVHVERVLSRLFRRRFLEALEAAHRHGQLQFFGEYAELADPAVFDGWLAPLRVCEWVVYAKRPFAGPEAVLAYLSRNTHRVAISNQRLISSDERDVTFRWKDYRARERNGNVRTACGANGP
jgi:hypothetical protein